MQHVISFQMDELRLMLQVVLEGFQSNGLMA